MRKQFLLIVAVCLAASLAVAQAPDAVCEIHVNKVKPAMTAQYEQGRAKHMAWHKSQNDSWSWVTWEITTGDNTGGYLIGTCGHPWKDFDAREKFNTEDGANANATMGASLAGEAMSYYVHRADLSRPGPQGPPPPYISVVHFHVKPEGLADFTDAVKKITAAINKTNTPSVPSNWYQLASGGHGPEFVLVQERKGIGDMQAKSPKTLEQIVQEAGGDASIVATLRKAYYSTYSELLHYRPDLSYMPAAKP